MNFGRVTDIQELTKILEMVPRLYERAGSNLPRSVFSSSLANSLMNPLHEIYEMKVGDRLIGFYWAEVTNLGDYWVHALYVDDPTQNDRSWVEFIKERARKNGCRRVTCVACTDAHIRLWKSHGLYADTVVMALDLDTRRIRRDEGP